MKKMIVLPEDAAEGEIVQNISQEAEDLHAEIWNQFRRTGLAPPLLINRRSSNEHIRFQKSCRMIFALGYVHG